MTRSRALVRPARRADAERLVALLVAQFREHRIKTPVRRIGRAVDGVLRHRERGRVLVATLAGPPIRPAALSVLLPPEHGGRSALVERAYLEPPAPRRGRRRAPAAAARRLP